MVCLEYSIQRDQDKYKTQIHPHAETLHTCVFSSPEQPLWIRKGNSYLFKCVILYCKGNALLCKYTTYTSIRNGKEIIKQ